MSSNLLKSYHVSRDMEGARVINSNEIVEQKLERIRMVLPQVNLDEFQAVDIVEGSNLLDPLDALIAEFEEGGLTDTVIKAQPVAEPVYEGPTPEELVVAAQEEIEAMRVQAMEELQAEQQRVLASARAEGYEAGRAQGLQECEALKADIEKERMRLQAMYEQQVDALEPQFVKALTGIYEKIFEVGLDNQKEIVVTLLRNTMKKLDGCKNFLVHVSTADYAYVKEHKEELFSESTPEGTVIDIVEDSMMRESECTIETVGGIYDCGLGVQLQGLRKKLALLSYNAEVEG